MRVFADGNALFLRIGPICLPVLHINQPFVFSMAVNEYGEKNNCGNTANKISKRCCGNYAVGRN